MAKRKQFSSSFMTDLQADTRILSTFSQIKKNLLNLLLKTALSHSKAFYGSQASCTADPVKSVAINFLAKDFTLLQLTFVAGRENGCFQSVLKYCHEPIPHHQYRKSNTNLDLTRDRQISRKT